MAAMKEEVHALLARIKRVLKAIPATSRLYAAQKTRTRRKRRRALPPGYIQPALFSWHDDGDGDQAQAV